jgi:hypothetical protein
MWYLCRIFYQPFQTDWRLTMNRDNRLAVINAQSDWRHARRGTMLQDVVCAIAGCPVDLLSFDDLQERLQF